MRSRWSRWSSTCTRCSMMMIPDWFLGSYAIINSQLPLWFTVMSRMVIGDNGADAEQRRSTAGQAAGTWEWGVYWCWKEDRVEILQYWYCWYWGWDWVEEQEQEKEKETRKEQGKHHMNDHGMRGEQWSATSAHCADHDAEYGNTGNTDEDAEQEYCWILGDITHFFCWGWVVGSQVIDGWWCCCEPSVPLLGIL